MSQRSALFFRWILRIALGVVVVSVVVFCILKATEYQRLYLSIIHIFTALYCRKNGLISAERVLRHEQHIGSCLNGTHTGVVCSIVLYLSLIHI